VQNRQIQATLATGEMPSKDSVKTGHELLMRWCAATTTAPNVISHPLFDAYVHHVSGQRHNAPTRYFLLLALNRLAERVRSNIVQKMSKKQVEACVPSRHVRGILGCNRGMNQRC
jgi:hypothetical protein